MTWLVPSAIAIGIGAVIAVAALHFISRTRPLAEPLPTTRFIPLRPVSARARAIKFSDLLLLLMRAAAVLALAFAVAGPMPGGGGRTARVVLVDRSRAVANAGEVRDSARALAGAGAVIIPFDSVAAPAGASIDSVGVTTAPGSLSTALAAAQRAAVGLAQRADSVELVMISPLAAEEVDAATEHLRAAWPGRVRVVPVRASVAPAWRPHVAVVAPPNDAVAAGLALLPAGGTDGAVRVVRGTVSAADSLWARERGHALVVWPSADTRATWQPRTAIDAIGGVASHTGALVGRFPRAWNLSGESIARWADGEPAAVERATGDGCIRDVSILIDEASDITLRAPFRHFAAGLLGPCGGARSATPIAPASRAMLSGSGPLASASLLRDRDGERSRWTSWLLALSALLLIGELGVRRTQSRTQSRAV